MSKIESLEREIERLSPEDLAEFRRWFTSFDEGICDQQIEGARPSGLKSVYGVWIWQSPMNRDGRISPARSSK